MLILRDGRQVRSLVDVESSSVTVLERFGSVLPGVAYGKNSCFEYFKTCRRGEFKIWTLKIDIVFSKGSPQEKINRYG